MLSPWSQQTTRTQTSELRRAWIPDELGCYLHKSQQTTRTQTSELRRVWIPDEPGCYLHKSQQTTRPQTSELRRAWIPDELGCYLHKSQQTTRPQTSELRRAWIPDELGCYLRDPGQWGGHFLGAAAGWTRRPLGRGRCPRGGPSGRRWPPGSGPPAARRTGRAPRYIGRFPAGSDGKKKKRKFRCSYSPKVHTFQSSRSA